MVYIQPLKFVPDKLSLLSNASTLFPATSLLLLLVSSQFICKTTVHSEGLPALFKSNPSLYLFWNSNIRVKAFPEIRNAFCTSLQDILFDINSFGGFLTFLSHFGNIDKQDPVFHFGRNFIFFHIIRQQDTLLESGIGEFAAQYFVFLLLLFLVLFFHADYQIVAFIHITLKSFLVIPGAAILPCSPFHSQ